MKKLSFLALSAMMLLGVMSSCNQKTETHEPPKAVNVIYMIGDGMSLPQVYAAMLASGEKMVFSQFPYIGVVDTHSASNDITDSAASGTALASEHKTKNGMVGMNPDTLEVKTVLEVLAEQGKDPQPLAPSQSFVATKVESVRTNLSF